MQVALACSGVGKPNPTMESISTSAVVPADQPTASSHCFDECGSELHAARKDRAKASKLSRM